MPFQYRIEQITFSDNTTVTLPNLTVLIGPNNSGKSRALKDILELAGSRNPNPVVIRSVNHPLPLDAQALNSSYGIAPGPNPSGYLEFKWISPTLNKSDRTSFGNHLKWPEDFTSFMMDQRDFASYFGVQLIALLTTEMRLRLAAEGESSREDDVSNSFLQLFYAAGRNKEMELRHLVKQAFPNVEVALDFSVPRIVQFRVGSDFSKLPADPREARPILTKSDRLDDQGDGLRSYVGLVAALATLKRPVFLIDEPETFLHPPQAFRMGEFIATQASAAKQIIVATHSADVLRGIIFKSHDAKIIRIDRIGNSNPVRVLNQEELRTLVNDPLLSAANVLDGLFYPCVVVTEAESDSRFLNSVSNKLNPSSDIYFVNADNKQTVPKVLGPYKRLGVRCAGVVDIDVLNNATEFKKQLDAAGISGGTMVEALAYREKIDKELNATPAADRLQIAAKSLSQIKTHIDSALAGKPEEHQARLDQVRRDLDHLKAEASAWHPVKKMGFQALKGARSEFEKLYEICKNAGLFINPSGELESSLSDHGIEWTPDKRAWINKALQLVPSMQPDVSKQPWKFVTDIHEQLRKMQNH